jgi:hypothetical protein
MIGWRTLIGSLISTLLNSTLINSFKYSINGSVFGRWSVPSSRNEKLKVISHQKINRSFEDCDRRRKLKEKRNERKIRIDSRKRMTKCCPEVSDRSNFYWNVDYLVTGAKLSEY